MPRFSANLGFLWGELSLPDAIVAAKQAGFDAVECHWPYETPVEDVRKALADTGLPMLGLNTIRGNTEQGDTGLCALPDRKEEARRAIEQAIDYAAQIDTPNIHVMAGSASGDAAHATFLENLQHATKLAAANGQTILIEPLNKYAIADYFLKTTGQASEIIRQVGAGNLKLMFDCFHVQMMEGDLSNKLAQLMPIIGHIQFAAAPDRGPPDDGEINYAHIFRHLDRLGYDQPLGAEYLTNGPTEPTLGWMKTLI